MTTNDFYNPKNPDQLPPALPSDTQEFSQTGLPPDPAPQEIPIVPAPYGATLAEGDFQSLNFRTGESGWRIRSDGSAEFRSITANLTQLLRSYTAGETITQGQPLVPQPFPVADVTYDTSTSAGASAGSGSPITKSFTVGNHNDRMLVVITDDDGTGASAISGITYAGIAMTEKTWTNSGNWGSITGARSQIWTLAAPATGANNLVITPAGATLRDVRYIIYSFYNVATAAVIASDAHTGGAPNTISLAGTPSVNGSVIFGFYAHSNLTATTTVVNSLETLTYNGTTIYAGICSPVYPRSSRTITMQSGANSAVQLELTPVQTNATQRVYLTKADILGRTTGFIGFANSTVLAGEKVNVVLAGIASGLSGLTLGNQYYLSDTAGAISSSAGTNTRKVAIAVSTTEVLVTNIW